MSILNPIVKFENVYKHFFNKEGKLDVLNNISFEVQDNEIVTLVGPSGAGKSTILNLISGLITQDSGAIKTTKQFGYMFQKDNLFPWRTVYKNVILGLEIKGKITEDDKKYVLDLLNKYGLKEFIDSYPSTLSGGMRQRVALIRTLALKPNLLLLDEPFSALDYITRLNLEDDVNNIIRKEQKSAIIVTHDISEAISLSDRVIVISKRPSKILGNYQIKLNFEGKEHTPTNARTTKEFQVYFDKIYKDLSHEE